jgi:phosphoribosylformylglycinamidine cyclo-ligase
MDTYEMRGVSSSKEEVHAAIGKLDKGVFPGAFCKIIRVGQRYAIKHADGAGSKAVLAYLAHKHGFPIAVYRGISQDSIVMNIDDAACAGAYTNEFYLTQQVNRNKFLITGAMLKELIEGAAEFCQQLAHLGHRIVSGGGETADLADQSRTLTVDNDLFIFIRGNDVIDTNSVKAGDVIVGFSSTGQAKWEKEPNSGIGSNGLTSARHDLLCPDYRVDSETYAPEMLPELVYRGPFHLDDNLLGDSQFTIGSALLSRTRTYLPLIAGLMDTSGMRSRMHALIHCSGGGQTKIGKFGPSDVKYRKDKLFPLSPLFATIQRTGSVTWYEMYKTYNMGHRLEAVVSPDVVQTCIDIAAKCNIEAKDIGRVVPRAIDDPNRVEILAPNGDWCVY